MPLFQWSNSLSVNVREIDEQHRRLIALINKLFDAMSSGEGKKVLSEVIQGLVDYTVYHFSTEEKYFEQFNYPEATPHKEEHRKFVARVQSFQSEFNEGKTGLSVEMWNFLKDWLVNHIRGTDKKYSRFFNEHGLV